MRSIRASSMVRGITAVAVFFALCGMSIRIPLPLNAAGAAIRAKRARRTETVAELAAQVALSEQTSGSTCVAATARKDATPSGGLPALLNSFVAAGRRHFLESCATLPICNGSQRLLPLRC